MTPGVYGLSNHLLDTPWPKVQKGKQELGRVLANDTIRPNDIFAILKDRAVPSDDRLPDTGVGLKWERLLAPIFIKSRTYGTRASSVVMIDRGGRVTFSERNFDLSEKGQGRTFRFSIAAPKRPNPAEKV